jgi:hypothetical protein
MHLPYFKEIDISMLKDYYEVDIEFEEKKLQIDLNFEKESIVEKEMDPVVSILENLNEAILKILNYIQLDFKNGDEVNEFINFHLEELSEEELKGLFTNANSNLSKEEQFLSVIRLKRISLYPEEEIFAIFDFSIDDEVSQYLLVVKVNAQIELDHITMES